MKNTVDHTAYIPTELLDHIPKQRVTGARHASETSDNILRITLFTVLGALIPGTAHLAAGRKIIGSALITITLLIPALAIGLYLSRPDLKTAISLSTNPQILLAVAFAAVLGWLAWALTLLDGHFALRQNRLSVHHRILLTVLVTLLTTGLALPTYAVANTAMLQRSVLTSVFATEVAAPATAAPKKAAADPWQNVSRVNVMLLGSDAGVGRTGTRPDTIMVASIDAASGNTVLLSLPRNLQYARFKPGSPGAKAWPRGFRAEPSPLINGIWSWAESNSSLFPKETNPGLAATQSAVEQTLGLDVHYWATVNLAGFEDLINAIGGVELNVTKKIAIAKSDATVVNQWIKPGKQRLNGHDALWFGRSRWKSDDYSRMRRQRCLVGAVAKQTDPVTLARAFPKLARSARRNVQTSIPAQHIDAFVILGQRIQKANLTSVAFTDQVISTGNPDFSKIRRLTREAITQSTKPQTTAPTTTSPGRKAPTASDPDDDLGADLDDTLTSGQGTSANGGSGTTKKRKAEQPQSLDDVCSY